MTTEQMMKMQKEMAAKMQIEAKLAETLAGLTTLSQYIDPNSDYGKALKTLTANLSKDTDKLANS